MHLDFLVSHFCLSALTFARPHESYHIHHNCTNGTTTTTTTTTPNQHHNHTKTLTTHGQTDLWIGFSDKCEPTISGTTIEPQNRTSVPVIARNNNYWTNFEPNDPKPCVQVYWGRVPPKSDVKDAINKIVLHREADMQGTTIAFVWQVDMYKLQKRCYHLEDFGIRAEDWGKGWGSIHSAHVRD